MGSIRRSKTKRRTRDLDQIHADLRSTKHLAQFKATKAAEDLPGLGKFYCVECSRWFEGEHNLKEHKRGKNHKRRLRLLKEKPYTQKEAEAAAGLGTYQDPKEEVRSLFSKHHIMAGHYKHIRLFGGAMEAEYPYSFTDLSDVRQIPSNQECFGDRSGLDYINFDITQRVSEADAPTDKDALKFHLDDLIEEDNFVFADPVETTVPCVTSNPPALMGFCFGKAEATGKYIGMLLLLVRLKEKLTDLVVTVVIPDLDPATHGVENGVERGPRFEQAYVQMRHFRETFKINDWALFDAEDD